MTNAEFHEGGVGYSTAVVQFVTVAIGLVLGGTAFALTPQGRGTGRVSDFIPDGVLLVVGTILLGIGLGQLGNERLMTPRWNWVSFVGLTVSGMLVLVVLAERSRQRSAEIDRQEVRPASSACSGRSCCSSVAWA